MADSVISLNHPTVFATEPLPHSALVSMEDNDMEHEARVLQNEIQVAHELREAGTGEPLYGLAPEPGEGGPESVGGDQAQPRVEQPTEEPESALDTRTNMTWGIVLGVVLLLFLLVAVLYLGIGNTYSSAPFTNYPLK